MVFPAGSKLVTVGYDDNSMENRYNPAPAPFSCVWRLAPCGADSLRPPGCHRHDELDHQQSVVKVPRCTEGGDAPAWQGETREHTGSIRPRSNAAGPDAAPAECSGTFTTGCQVNA